MISKPNRKIISLAGGTGIPVSINNRITVLENNEYKITYFASVSAATGTITPPTGATILLGQLQGFDAYASTIVNGEPSGVFPKTAGGVEVDVSSFDALGNYTLSGTPSAYPIALIYVFKINAVNLVNAIIANRLDLEDINAEKLVNKTTNFVTLNNTLYPTVQAVVNYIASFGYGTGTVTNTSGVTANGFTWSITNPTTTPAITLTLQNATTSQSGQLTSTDWNTFNNKQNALGYTPYNATNPSGYISGNQTITLSGDVSGSGATSITTTIGAGKVTNAMLAGSISNSNLANSAITINGTSASLGGSITVGLPMQPVISNVKRMQPYVVLSTTTGLLANIWYSAYFTGDTHTVKSIDIEVTVAVAASNVRLCLYADDGTGKPGALIESSGDISAATTGTKSYSFSSPIALTAQIYWLGFQASSNSIQVRYISSGISYIYSPSIPTSNGYIQAQSYGAFPSNATPVSNATTIATTLTPQ